MFTKKIVTKKDLIGIFDFLSRDYLLFTTKKEKGNYFIEEYVNVSEFVFPEYRMHQSLKTFLIPAKGELNLLTEKKFAIFGLKACDLASLTILDYVYLQGDFKDPYYANRRENCFIFSSDCTGFKDVCFCTSLGYKPYPKQGFDLNLVKLDEDEYILEFGSEKGKKFLDKKGLNFQDLNSLKQKQLENIREEIVYQVKENADKYLPQRLKDSLTQVIRENYDSEIWVRESKRCVECAACTAICPTCHCFFLITRQDSFDKLLVWDSCLLKTYALVAGGANPRKKLSERLRNRFIKKFDFFPWVIDTFGCTGCGRCISACLGNIDLRKILNELVISEIRT